MTAGWPAIEVAWTIVAVFSLVVAVFNLADAIGDDQAVIEKLRRDPMADVGLQAIVATAGIRIAIPLALGPATFLGVGVIALQSPDPATAPSSNAILLVGALFVASGAFALTGLAIALGRRAAVRYVRAADLAARIEAARRDRRSTDKTHKHPGGRDGPTHAPPALRRPRPGAGGDQAPR